jgi:hypothetical protein
MVMVMVMVIQIQGIIQMMQKSTFFVKFGTK